MISSGILTVFTPIKKKASKKFTIYEIYAKFTNLRARQIFLFHNLSLYYSKKGLETWPKHNRDWLMQDTLKRFLEKLAVKVFPWLFRTFGP